MRMIKKIGIIIVVLTTSLSYAQQSGSPSPYSFYGIGTQQFRGTSENRAMGGLSVYSDSLHFNLRNPASLGKVRFVTFTVGGAHDEVNLEDANNTGNSSNSSLNYIALRFPVAKNIGVSFGLIPFTSVGYQLDQSTDLVLDRFSGSGGLNRVFLSAGFQPIKGLTIGASGEFNFGNIQNEALQSLQGIELGTQENNRSNLFGFTANLGAQYETPINEKLRFYSSASYIPNSQINSENSRTVSSVEFNNLTFTAPVDTQEILVPDSDFDFPSALTLGIGVGQKDKWFFGGEFTNQTNSSFTNRSFTLDNASFEDATQVRLGGFYIPDHTSISSYFKKITYRAGVRFEETGLIISNESIDEFGISFGVGLPAGRILSNINIGFEYTQRGTTNANLVQENIFNFNISASLNDIWFIKSKFN